MKRYIVLVGTHAQGGKVYTKGQTCVSAADLVALFPGKFEEAGPAPQSAQPKTPANESDPFEGSERPGRVASSRPSSKSGG